MAIVHEEERAAIVARDVAGGEVLAVAPKVGEAERLLVERADEAGRSAAELDVRPTGGADRGEVEAVARFDEGDLVGAEELASTFWRRILEDLNQSAVHDPRMVPRACAIN